MEVPDGGRELEMPLGWSLNGLTEIRRPLSRAYNACKGLLHCENAEWQISGPGMAGTLKPSGRGDWRFFLSTSSATYVVAQYHPKLKSGPTAFGLLTRSVSSAGWLDGGETLNGSELAISYERGLRGELEKSTDEATGIYIAQTYDFGGAVVKTQTNALNQSLTSEIDNQGRITSIQDPNGMKETSVYDVFGRVKEKKLSGKGGTSNSTLATSTFYRDKAPFYTVSKMFNVLGGKGDGLADEEMVAVENGFGNMVQNWKQWNSFKGKFFKCYADNSMNK